MPRSAREDCFDSLCCKIVRQRVHFSCFAAGLRVQKIHLIVTSQVLDRYELRMIVPLLQGFPKFDGLWEVVSRVNKDHLS